MEEARPLPLPEGKRVRPLRQSDARLVRRAAKNDQRAFAEIFERYGQDLYRFCRAILGNPDDAQDALQNTMSRVLRALPGERRSLQLRPWLFRVARNEALSLIRSREQTVELADGFAPAAPGADIRAEHREEVRTLVADLAALPEAQRTALVLHELNGLSHTEISEAMQRSPRASRQAIYEARLALQDLKEGRDMECDYVRALISDGDGRVMRGRKVRAHLRECRRCADFELGIGERAGKLGLLAPPLPAAAASGLFAAAMGGSGVAGGVAGGAGALGVAGGSLTLKSIGVVGAGLALGLGGVKVAGVDLTSEEKKPERVNLVEEDSQNGAPAASPAGAGVQSGIAQKTESGSRGKDEATGHRAEKRSKRKHRGSGKQDPSSKPGKPGSAGPQNAAPGSNAGGASALAPAGSGKPETPPGQAISNNHSSGQGGPPSSPGPPAHAGGGPPAHSNAGGNSSGNGKPDK